MGTLGTDPDAPPTLRPSTHVPPPSPPRPESSVEVDPSNPDRRTGKQGPPPVRETIGFDPHVSVPPTSLLSSQDSSALRDDPPTRLDPGWTDETTDTVRFRDYPTPVHARQGLGPVWETGRTQSPRSPTGGILSAPQDRGVTLPSRHAQSSVVGSTPLDPSVLHWSRGPGSTPVCPRRTGGGRGVADRSDMVRVPGTRGSGAPGGRPWPVHVLTPVIRAPGPSVGKTQESAPPTRTSRSPSRPNRGV